MSRRPGACRERARRPAARPRAGVTLVELMVALFILSIALLGLAGMSGTVARLLGGGANQTVAAMVVQSRFDSLASIAPCQNLVPAGGRRTGSATTRGVRESWVIEDGDDVVIVTDTARFAARPGPLVYRSIIVCRD